METTLTAHQTSFGMFCPCDKATYRKLKQINHIITQHASVWMRRWQRSQARQPHNRRFVIRKQEYIVKDSWIFSDLWETTTKKSKAYNSRTGQYDEVSQNLVYESFLMAAFRRDYESARHPVKTLEEVKELNLSIAQIDKLHRDLLAFSSRDFSTKKE